MVATYRIAALLLVGLAPAASLAQPPELIAAVEKIAAAEPAPTPAEIVPQALELLRNRAKSDGKCSPRSVSVGGPASALLTLIVTQRMVAREIRNAWTVDVRPEGCPDRRPARLIVYRQSAGTLDVQFMAFGEGIALPVERNIFLVVAGAAYAKLASAKGGCAVDKLRFESTRIASRSADLGPDVHGTRFKGTWSEIWTFRGCGREVEAPVTFVTDGLGGLSWSADYRQVRFVGKGS
jgi:hypothetical protein